MTLSTTALSKISPSRMALVIMTTRIIKLSILTLSILTLCITTLCIIALGTRTLSITKQTEVTQYNDNQDNYTQTIK
jgi:hypothetical protein